MRLVIVDCYKYLCNNNYAYLYIATCIVMFRIYLTN